MMLEKTTIAKNAGILVMTDVVTRILGALLTIFIARKLGAANLGLLAFALSFTELFSFLTNFGFRNLISRDVAKEPHKTGSYLGSISVIKLVLSVLVLFLIISTLYLMHCTQEKMLVVCIAAFIMVLTSFIDFFAAFFRAHQKAEYEALIKIILSFLRISTGLIILFLGYGLVPLMSVQFLVYLFSFALGFSLVVKKLSKPDFNIKWDVCIHLIKSAVPFAMLVIVVSINTQMGTVLLSFMKGYIATGWFSAAQKLCGVFSFIPAAFVGAVLPAMSKFSQRSMHESLVKTYEGTIKYLLIIVLPLAVGISILADDFILMVYGREYIQSIIVLRILIWSLVFSFFNYACMIAFASINKEKKFVRIQVLGTLVNFCANITLIPLMGPVGVSIATVFSQIIVFAFSAYILSKSFRQAGIQKISMRPVLAVILMSFFLFLFKQQDAIILVPLSGLLYGLALFLLRTFNNNELYILRELFRRKLAKF